MNEENAWDHRVCADMVERPIEKNYLQESKRCDQEDKPVERLQDFRR